MLNLLRGVEIMTVGIIVALPLLTTTATATATTVQFNSFSSLQLRFFCIFSQVSESAMRLVFNCEGNDSSSFCLLRIRAEKKKKKKEKKKKKKENKTNVSGNVST